MVEPAAGDRAGVGTRLVVPGPAWYESWRETLLDFDREFPHGSGNGAELVDLDPDSFAAYVEERLRYADPRAVLPQGRVPCRYYWIVEEPAADSATGAGQGEMVGFLALRLRLTEWLLEEGGHIGYSVRPDRRRRGHAGRALRLAVAEAAEHGLARVLVTCDDDNHASRRTIERCGGELEDVRSGKRRYWIRTAAAGSAPAPG